MIYLLHFSRPYKGARHYLGTMQNLRKRLFAHRHGRGARLLAAVIKRGISIRVVRTWRGSFDTEKRLKALKDGPGLCPVCRNR